MPRSPLPETGSGRLARPGEDVQVLPPDAVPSPPHIPGQISPDHPMSVQPAAGGNASGGTPGSGPGASGSGASGSGGQPGSGEGGEGGVPDPLSRYTPPTPKQPGPRKAIALRPARLTGDRDYYIYIECRADSVVLYPSQRIFPLLTLSRSSSQGNPLMQSVQQMIDRRQASVPAGTMPYRPQICFLVRSDSVRAYHVAYPALDALTVPKIRHNLEPEDDVLTIVTGR